MYVDPVNPIIKKTLSEFLQKQLSNCEKSYDSDDVVYQILGDPDNNRVLYSFKCNAAAQIFENGGNEMLAELYADHALPKDEWIPDWDVTLQVSTEGLPKTQKIKKTMTEEEQEQIRNSNEEIRTQRAAQVDKVADKIAQFKRDFIGAPVRKALMALKNRQAPPVCEIPYRQDEKYWITGDSS